MAGSANFMNSYLTKQDFAAVTLFFVPFLIVALVYKTLAYYWDGKEKGPSDRKPLRQVFFGNFQDPNTGAIDWYYV